jgi:hypothetical protein
MYIMEDFGMEKAGIFSGHLDFLEVNFAFGRVCIYGPKVFNQHFSFGSVSTDINTSHSKRHKKDYVVWGIEMLDY